MLPEPIVMDRFTRQNRDMFFLWVDAVGGFWVCLADEIVLGQAVPSSGADIPIMGDLSKQHARIRRDGEGYLIEAIRDVRVDGRNVDQMALLGQQSTIELGSGVRLAFRRPHALSATARLDFTSGHRTQPTSDAVLLMADSCVLGPKPTSHVICRQWSEEVVLYRHGDQLYCRSAGSLEIDGTRRRGRSPITRSSRIVGDRFSMSLEPVS
jgi:hypothetical protein